DTLRAQKVFKLFHEESQVEDELSRIVEAGGRVESLLVYHRVYGKIEVPLLIENRTHIADYIHALSGNSRPLAAVTGGYHYHLVTADSAQTIERVEAALKEGGYLAE
ncbi:MAG: 3H domain-containing protein, partial [Christensenellaceae bacterium]